jgi:CubicO group peptidase (beta-lactamase class C family)
MMELIEDEDYPIYSVLVIKNGYVVFERYPHEYISENHLQLLHSVTKSFISALIGIAIHQGFIDGVNESVLNFFPEYTIANPDSRKDSITIQDLLTMTSGFDWDEWSTPYEYGSGNNLMEMMASSDAVQYVLDRPMSDTPGDHWVYNGGASVLLGAIVQQVSNQSTLSFALDYLFDPLGFGSSFWYTTSGGWINAHGGLSLTTRDLAKLGFLYLNNGIWNGTRILSPNFVLNTTTPIDLPNPLGSNFGFGWHWWMRSDLGIYFAYGRHGQKIMVAPEYDMVVVFTANVPDDGYDPEFMLFRDYILQAISTNTNDNSPLVTGILSVSGFGIIIIVILYTYKRKRMT